jgi:hypothetical protein
VRERLFLEQCSSKAGPKTFGYPRHAPFVDGGRRSRKGKSPVRIFVPCFLNICSDSFIDCPRHSLTSLLKVS